VEAVPGRLWATHAVVAFQVEYRRQSAYGDTVTVATHRGPGSGDAAEQEFHHVLRTAGDGPDLVRARTVWRPVGRT
jgi:hypothetical protein